MNADQLFATANLVALFAWIPLIALPQNTTIRLWVFRIPLVGLALTYVGLFGQFFEPSSFEAFSTLDGLQSLFSSKEAVLLGWVHYLAFDLLAGLYIAQNGEKHKINPWLVRLCLPLTFLAGPVGLLAYIILRGIITKKYDY